MFPFEGALTVISVPMLAVLFFSNGCLSISVDQIKDGYSRIVHFSVSNDADVSFWVGLVPEYFLGGKWESWPYRINGAAIGVDPYMREVTAGEVEEFFMDFSSTALPPVLDGGMLECPSEMLFRIRLSSSHDFSGRDSVVSYSEEFTVRDPWNCVVEPMTNPSIKGDRGN